MNNGKDINVSDKDMTTSKPEQSLMAPSEVGGDTVPMRPQTPKQPNQQKKAQKEKQKEERKGPRPGEITPDMVNEQTSTKKLYDTDFEDGDPRWGTARFNNRMLLEIKLRDTGERFMFDYTDSDEILIGRRDPASGNSPEIDLEPYDALNKGVSRRHAQIARKDGALNLIDLGSPNGTFLNGQKLVERQPRILRDGDDVRLGHLVVRISFRRTNGTGKFI